ncbi:MAG: polysaccharide deacetylase family protein [Chitinophagaceae bacterium]|nr:polysaccharide deacetylase family protein [Chitinophagaceae bacterium]
MFYLPKTPWLLRQLAPARIWSIPSSHKTVYLTFDDGPHPEITSYVLDQLKIYKALGTFFCIGSNVLKFQSVYQRIIAEGHSVGNHTYDHINGWKTDDVLYLENIELAAKEIRSALFRPPYGRMRSSQAIRLLNAHPQTKIIMWDVLSGDFDIRIDAERCTQNVLKNVRAGSIIVMHDSVKAFPRLKECLRQVLDKLSEEGYTFSKID